MYSAKTNNFVVNVLTPDTSFSLRLENPELGNNFAEIEGRLYLARISDIDNIENVTDKRINSLFRKYPNEPAFRKEINRRIQIGIYGVPNIPRSIRESIRVELRNN